MIVLSRRLRLCGLWSSCLAAQTKCLRCLAVCVELNSALTGTFILSCETVNRYTVHYNILVSSVPLRFVLKPRL